MKLMFQIPEMQLYVDTKGYTDFSKFNRQETLGSLSRSLSRSMSAEREFSAPGTPSLDPISEDEDQEPEFQVMQRIEKIDEQVKLEKERRVGPAGPIVLKKLKAWKDERAHWVKELKALREELV